MPRVAIPLPTREGKAKSRFVSSQSLTNMFVERAEDHGPALYGAHGLVSFVTLDTAPVRGDGHDFNGALVVVSGDRLYTVTEAGVATDRGGINGTAPVIMSSNGFEVMITADELSYLWDGTTLTQITDADLEQSSSNAFVGQYFLSSIAETGRWQLSGLADGSAWDATDVATAESEPDVLLRVFADQGEAVLLGAKTTEFWANTGGSDFPFQRLGSINLGLLGKLCVAPVDNSFAFAANDGTVRIVRGRTPQRISDHEIEGEIASWPDPDTSRAFSYTIRGHAYWVLRNPHGCVVWDAATGLWHRRKSADSDTWRVGGAVEIWNGVYLGDATDGVIYRADEGESAEADVTMLREFVSLTMNPGNTPFTVDEVELLIDPGVGIGGSGQGSDPEVWLQASRDSGKTWGARMQRKIGARGVYNRRVVWRSLGQFPPRGCALKFGCSDPVSVAMTGAAMTMEADLP